MEIDKSRFKDKMGRFVTLSLFYELATDKSFAVYSLGEEDREIDGVVYPSLKKLYLESMDPTGYRFAKKHLFNWKHWVKLKANQKLYDDHFSDWEDEMEVFLKSDAISSIIIQADDSFPAAKFVACKEWEKRAGRPTKDEIKREDRIAEKIADEFEDDIERLGNVVEFK